MSRFSVPHPNCNRTCKQFEAKKPIEGTRYGQGQKRCQMCETWVKYEGNWCPCCHYRLRSKSRLARCKPQVARI